MNEQELTKKLTAPFETKDVEWRIQQTTQDKSRGLAVAFITSRAIQRRLDETVGPFHWKTEFSPWHQIGNGSQLCALSIYDEERKEWVTKTDGAENSDIEPVKGGLSDSFKRAAVQWGIGRVLYNMDVVFVDVEKRGKTWYMKKDQQERLDYAYLKMLGKLNLTPAPAGGLRPQAETEGGGEGPAGQAKPAETSGGKTEGMPAGGSKPEGITYIIRHARINKGMNSSSTQLKLESSQGDKLEAFVRGEHPELAVGVVLANAKLEKRQKDTVVYYMLEEFKIAETQPQAA